MATPITQAIAMPDTFASRLRRIGAALFTMASMAPALADNPAWGIAIHGAVSMHFNTEGMYRASRTSSQALQTAIFAEAGKAVK